MQSGLRRRDDDAGAARVYRSARAPDLEVDPAARGSGIAAFQIVGSFGAADNQPERKALDVAALLLLFAGPVALAWRDRIPLVALG